MDREAKEKAERLEQTVRHEALFTYKSQTAGNLAHLLKNLHEQTNHTHDLQISFLRNAVDTVKDYLGLDRSDDQISATWVVPTDNYTKWETRVYDRNQAGRMPGRKRAIAPGIPGCAEAFLTGNTTFIADTLAPDIAKHFDRAPLYRSILSMPARTMNVTHNSNVTIDGHPNAIVGVLNIDCRVPGILRADIAKVVGDIAYLVGVLEHINQGFRGGSNG